MKRSLAVTAVVLLAAACAAVQKNDANPYENPPFYAKYLNTGSQLDAQITATLEGLRANPQSATLHNELGALLVQKNFPKDAQLEFERAVAIDPKFYSAWYNLGLVRAHLTDPSGASDAFERTVDLKPGHPQALFQLGLTAEKQGQKEKAVEYYAKAYTHNARLMDVRYNPRILDSKLTHLALLKLYGQTHSRQSSTFMGPPAGYTGPQTATPEPQPAPVPQQPAPAAAPASAPAPVTPVVPPPPTDPAGAVTAPPSNPITQTTT
jgi:tetratricopeptide (TPR) repeat protein